MPRVMAPSSWCSRARISFSLGVEVLALPGSAGGVVVAAGGGVGAVVVGVVGTAWWWLDEQVGPRVRPGGVVDRQGPGAGAGPQRPDRAEQGPPGGPLDGVLGDQGLHGLQNAESFGDVVEGGGAATPALTGDAFGQQGEGGVEGAGRPGGVVADVAARGRLGGQRLVHQRAGGAEGPKRWVDRANPPGPPGLPLPRLGGGCGDAQLVEVAVLATLVLDQHDPRIVLLAQRPP